MKTGIFYGSTMGNTESAAQQIGRLIDGSSVESVAGVGKGDFESYDLLLLGASTWGFGDLQDDWNDALPVLREADLKGKKVALFGLGDQAGYPDTFVDGIKELYDAATEAGATVIGRWPDKGYDFSASAAHDGDVFLGLVLDEDNQGSLTGQRIADWVAQILTEAQ